MNVCVDVVKYISIILLVVKYSISNLPPNEALQNRLALEILKFKPGTNLIVSTLPLYFFTCKLATVANEEARNEILKTLGMFSAKIENMNERMKNKGIAFEKYSRYTTNDVHNCYQKLKDPLLLMQKFSLIYINNIYVNYTKDVNEDFVVNSTEHGVSVNKVGFQYPNTAVSYINRVIEQKTYKRIKDMLTKDDIQTNTTMILANALYHQVNWATPFDYRLTKNQRFYRPNEINVVNVPMMTRASEYQYLEHQQWDCKIVLLPQAAFDVSVVIVMSNRRAGLPQLLDKIYENTQAFRKILKTLPKTPINLQLPLLNIKSYVDWTGFLQEMGLKKIFSDKDSGLNSILKPDSSLHNIRLNIVKQKVVFEMDEMGPFRSQKAAAAAIRDRDMTTFKPSVLKMVPSVIINNPFYFMVTIGCDYDLFNGVYYGPE